MLQELRGITPSLGLKMYFFEIYNIFKRFPLQKLKIEKWTCSSIFCQDKRCGFECGKVILIVHNCGLCGLLGWHLFMKNAPPWRLFAASWIYRDQWLDDSTLPNMTILTTLTTVTTTTLSFVFCLDLLCTNLSTNASACLYQCH